MSEDKEPYYKTEGFRYLLATLILVIGFPFLLYMYFI